MCAKSSTIKNYTYQYNMSESGLRVFNLFDYTVVRYHSIQRGIELEGLLTKWIVVIWLNNIFTELGTGLRYPVASVVQNFKTL